eukprot:3941644-Rhodomonas_salina.11
MLGTATAPPRRTETRSEHDSSDSGERAAMLEPRKTDRRWQRRCRLAALRRRSHQPPLPACMEQRPMLSPPDA